MALIIDYYDKPERQKRVIAASFMLIINFFLKYQTLFKHIFGINYIIGLLLYNQNATIVFRFENN